MIRRTALPLVLALLATAALALACVTPAAQPLDLAAHGPALFEVSNRHDRLLDVIERANASGVLEAIAPEFATPNLAVELRVWRRQSFLLRLAAVSSGHPGDPGKNPDAE